ncbi:SMI1/KNR4 family protein [Actinosynnema sp. NPDC050436]|uniref:SMI1/KNR4 family protein n=1 Tax=Actinosynnema sp. NPDC050436 TaxID=3155659 RepID=UPI003410FFBD
MDEIALLRAAVDGRGGAPLGWDAVRAFEAAHGVELPEPYRTFVAEVADGVPAGPPEYGVVELADLPRDWGAGRPERVLAEPFPLTATWVWENDPRPEAEVEPLIGPVHDHGSVVLGTDGCGIYWHLVVTGPHRGHVWYVTGEGAVPFGAEFGTTTGKSGFAGWVAHWVSGADWFS